MRFMIVLPFLATIGCTTNEPPSRPPVSELKQGLNLLDVSDPSWGMTAAYVKDGHVVYLEQRVGALKPETYRKDSPTEPANEIDMRFVDESGKTFFVQRGGDEYVDPSWNVEIRASLENPASDEQRIRDFVIAREAAQVFATSKLEGIAPFAYHAEQFARRLPPSQDPDMVARANKIESARASTDTELADWGAGGSWWLEGDLYDKGVCFAWICPARHSGVAIYAYQTTWQLVINACNHGNCPGSSKMSYRCYSTSGVWRDNPYLTAEINGGNSIGGGCRSGYSWNSGGYDHLCNDDSAYELWQVKNGSPGGGSRDTNGDGYNFVYTGAGTGGDGSWVNYACTCAYNNGCNNDWSRPICP